MPSCHFVSVVPRSSLVGFMASGCDSEAIRMDCLRVALNLQSIHNSQDCKEPGNPVSGIAGHREDCRRSTGPGLRSVASNRNPGQQSECNPSQLHQDCPKSRIQLQSSRLQISRSRLREDCENPKEPFLGIVGLREDCVGSQSTRLGLPSSLGSDLTVSR